MHYQEFYYWCRDAVSQIKYTPDRKKVYIELYTHLEDRYESFLAKGLSEKDAEQKALAAMGDPKELAPQLAAIHKPHWAYAMVVTRFLVSVLFCLTLSYGIVFFHDLLYLRDKELTWSYGQGKMITSVELDVADSSDGYTFRVPEARVYRVGEEDYICVRLVVTNPIPWSLEQKVLERMRAVDNFGNYYYSVVEQNREHRNGGYFYVDNQRQGLTSYYYELGLRNVSPDTRWVELHYDRAGRDLVLRIDLTGGEDNVESP